MERKLSIFKRIGCLVLALIMVLGLLPALPHTHAHAAGNVKLTNMAGEETNTFTIGEPIYVETTGYASTEWLSLWYYNGSWESTYRLWWYASDEKMLLWDAVWTDDFAWDGMNMPAGTYYIYYAESEELASFTLVEPDAAVTAEKSLAFAVNGKKVSIDAINYSEYSHVTITNADGAKMYEFYCLGRNGLTMECELIPGEYTISMYNDYYDAQLQEKKTFTIEGEAVKLLTTDKTEYKFGEPIMVTSQLGNPNWLGLYKQSDANPTSAGPVSLFWLYPTVGQAVNILSGEQQRPTEWTAGTYKVLLLDANYGIVASVENIVITTEIDESKTVTTPATCDENGYITYTYTDGSTKTVVWEDIEDAGLKEQLKATGHDYSAKPQPVEGVVGKHVYTCGNKAEHTKEEDCTWDKGEVTVEPEVGKDGEKTYTCTACGGKRTEAISAKTIDHTDTFDATCTKGSYKIDYYTDGTNSGEIATGTAALNHIYGQGVHNANSDPSTHTKTCTREGCTEAQEGHTVTENCDFKSSAVPGGTRYTCAGCGEYYDVIIMSTNKTEYALGEPILITVDPSVYDETANDWIGIWEGTLSHTDDISIYYYYPASEGWTDFNIKNSSVHQQPNTQKYEIGVGTYTLRMYTEKNGDWYVPITSVTITIGPAVRDESKTVRVEPTCTTDGSITYYLTDGTLEKVVTAAEDESLKRLGHAYPETWTPVAGTETHSRVCANNAEHVETKPCVWDEGVETVPATANSKGEMKYTCTVCGGTKLEEIPELNAEETGREVFAPTCTDQGYTLITYSDGSTRKVDFQPALDHDFSGAYIRVEGTHTHKQVCQRNDCDEVKVTDCRLETDGVSDGNGYLYSCLDCGEWTEPIIMTDKTIYASGEDIIVTIHPNFAATMGSKDWIGLYHKGEVPNQEMNPTSIRWDYAVEFKNGKNIFTTNWHDRPLDDPDNFLKAGEYTLFLCANDGYVVLTKVYITVTTEEDPTKTVRVEPTCTEDGTITYYNTDGTVSRVVTAAEDASLKAHDHTYGTWTYNGVEKQTHTHICACTTCAEPCGFSETKDCTWNDGVETKPATEQETGIKTYTCTVCQGTKEEVLPKLNVTVVDVKTDPATCDDPGLITTYYSDGTTAEKVIPAKGHDYSDWSMVLGQNKHQKVCANDPTHILTEDCTISSSVSGTKVTHSCSVCYGSYETGLVTTDKKVYGVTDPIFVTAYGTFPGAWVGLYKEGELFDPDHGGVASLFWAYTDGRVGQPFDLTAVEATTTSGHRGEKLGNGKYVLVFFGDSGYTNVIDTVEIEIFTDMSNVEFKVQFLGKNERENGAHIQVDANKFDYVSNSGNQVTAYITPLKKGTTEAADPLTAWIGIFDGALNLESEFAGLVPMGTFAVAEHNGTKITLNLPKYGMNFKPGYIYTLVVFADGGTSQPVKYITFESIREIESETVYKKATCDTPGSKFVVYKDDGKDHTEDSALIIIPALGHDMTELACIEGTNTHGKHCQREDCDYAEVEDCTFENDTCTVCGGTEYHIHSTTRVPAKPADCETSGNIEYYTCACGEYFADAEATQKIEDKNSVVIPAKQHAYSKWQYNKAEKKHFQICGNDATHVITESCSFDAGVVTKQPTAVAEGEKTFTCSVCKGTYTEAIPMVSYEGGERVFGATRYHTSLQIADTLKEALGVEKFDAIVVASGAEFADALSGTYLANKKNAPILLIRNRADELAMVKGYIQENLKPGGTIYLLGGTSAVPKAMETGMEGFNVKRLGGANRYDTNLLILKEAGVAPGEDILICTGKNFADGLSASALNKPILLVKDTLTTAQTDFLRSVTGGKIYIIGGNMAVNDRIASVLALYGQTQRISGETRYETSINIAKTFFADAENVVLAFGEDFPDGLCGGSLASSMNAPVILVANSANKYTMAAEYAAENGIAGGIALGGSGRITNNVMQKVFK